MNIDGDTLQSDFNRDGYVRLAGFMDADELGIVEERLARVIRDVVPTMPAEHVFYEEKSRPESLKQIQQLFKYDDYFEGMMLDSAFREVAEAVLKGPVVAKNMQYFNKPPIIGKPTPAHQDGYYFMLEPCSAVTMWFALDEVDEENGCVHYARGSHRLGLLPHGRTDTLGFSQGLCDTSICNESETTVRCQAAPGDLLAHHALTVHWAGGNRSATRTRRALGLIYYGGDAREDVAAYAAYQRKLTDEMSALGKI